MERISTANKAIDLFGPGRHGYQPGNPATGTSATFISPDALNAMQEEICSAIEGAGMAINPASNAQLLAAIQSLITNRNISGLVRSLTPIGGALVREWADIPSAATVGGIEIAYSYNVVIDPATGAWSGRDVADICWLQKWHDTAGTLEIWSAATAAAGVVPAWNQVFSFNAITGALTISGTVSAAQATAAGHLINMGQADARYAALAGLVTQIFKVANAVGPNDAVAYGQVSPLRTAVITPLPASGTSIVGVSHTLGRVPSIVDLEFTCITAEGGYAVGDVVKVRNMSSGSVAGGLSIWATATQVGAPLQSGGWQYILVTKTGGVSFTPNPANWSYCFVLR